MSSVVVFYTAYDATHRSLQERAALKQGSNKNKLQSGQKAMQPAEMKERKSGPITFKIEVKESVGSLQDKPSHGKYWTGNWE